MDKCFSRSGEGKDSASTEAVGACPVLIFTRAGRSYLRSEVVGMKLESYAFRIFSPVMYPEKLRDIHSEEASIFASTVDFSGDGKDAWIFDIDETLLSNLPYYIDHGFGVEVFDHSEFDKWVERGVAPAIAPSLKLYQRVIDLGYRVFLLTGRKESHRLVTVENLINAGFQNWDKLILRAPDEQHKLATLYKSEKRDEMVKGGYRIRGNSGDQWSDLLGSSMSQRSFKLPNPMYYIP
ncbi:unnamed protein product [Eruca vesicaria subsp. sativa]|uniref:Acid phosphatase n=1 Tax=Eruca vesicaria subsp. sativa TaxID=29727 RepID=A0ABC8IXU2_ERUVS|nr:unnamed protein product [Eruca vesicaria subsp. sativa]